MELSEAKAEAKNCFMEFIRGDRNPVNRGAPGEYEYEQLQKNLNTTDIRFDMMEGEGFVEIGLPKNRSVRFTSEEMLGRIFYGSPIYDQVPHGGYVLRDRGKKGRILFQSA